MLVPVTIQAVMNPTVETISPDRPALDAAELLHEEGIGSLVVVRDGTPVGVVTESDMVRLLAQQRDATALTTADIMSDPPITVGIEDSLERAVELFREHDIKKLPVMDGEKLVGIVTTTDISRYVPHLAHPKPSREVKPERRRFTRPDTLYENDDLFTRTSRFPSFSGIASIQSIINTQVIQPVVLGNATAEEACSDANSDVQEVVDEEIA
jgi:CBS domain-containing protein